MTMPTSSGLFNVVAGDEALRRQPARRREVLAAGAAAGQARGRRQDVQLSRLRRPTMRKLARAARRCVVLALAARGRRRRPGACRRARSRWRRSQPVAVDAAAAASALGAAVRAEDDRRRRPTSTPTPAEFHGAARAPAGELPEGARRRCKREVVGKYGLLYTWAGSDPKAQADRADGAPGRGADRARHREATGRPTPFAGAHRGRLRLGPRRVGRQGQPDVDHGGGRAAASPRASSRARRSTWSSAPDEEVGGERGAQQIAELLQGARRAACDFVLDEGLLITEGVLPGLDSAGGADRRRREGLPHGRS